MRDIDIENGSYLTSAFVILKVVPPGCATESPTKNESTTTPKTSKKSREAFFSECFAKPSASVHCDNDDSFDVEGLNPPARSSANVGANSVSTSPDIRVPRSTLG